MTPLADVTLARGANTIRLEAASAGFELGSLRLSLPEDGTRFGFPAYSGEVVDTGAWLGPINLAAAPDVYVPKMRGWLYAPTLAGGELTQAGQYFYFYSPGELAPFDESTAPWFYSIALQRWFYAPGAMTVAELQAAQWLYLF